jgi:hypothetical protein
LNDDGASTCHLGGDFKFVTEPEEMLTWGSHNYTKDILDQYEIMFVEHGSKRDAHAPMRHGGHLELGTIPLM